MRILLYTAVVLVLAWLAFVGIVYGYMSGPPDRFAAVMARMPMPLMFALPFETLWMRARGGTLQPGDAAPDFELTTLQLTPRDKTARVRLSAFRGKQPVVLIFGSYT